MYKYENVKRKLFENDQEADPSQILHSVIEAHENKIEANINNILQQETEFPENEAGVYDYLENVKCNLFQTDHESDIEGYENQNEEHENQNEVHEDECEEHELEIEVLYPPNTK